MADAPLLVTGGSGQLATALQHAATACGRAVRRVGRPGFDFDRPESIRRTFEEVRPAAVVNAAAYTAVDAAETDPDAAYRANRDGPAELARLCAEARVPLVHISTDYVFDGSKSEPYREDDPVNPQGVYGASKRAGEEAVWAAHPGAVVLRTSWVYAAMGKNFVQAMLGAAQRTNRLRVVADQQGCPTSAADLAAAILAILPLLPAGDAGSRIFHLAGTGSATWHAFATAVFESAARYGISPPAIEPIATADWPTAAKRPANSRLDCSLAASRFGVSLPHWRGSLDRVIDTIYSVGA
ncbi:MAG: dTDP-4-dehydrorhamnose reductase [Acetobacteraceae bacterium]|nr:dTDP-4-dehydrorhamnose reductase [Acetobacteraceae bacterium]